MEILAATTYSGPNLYAHCPVTRLTIDLGVLEEWPTKRLGPHFIDGLLTCLPGLHQHGCSYNTPGGFVRRMHEDQGTWLGHVMEHVAIELQKVAGLNTSFGKTRGNGKPRHYDVVYECQDGDVGVEAGYLARDLLQHLLPADLKKLRENNGKDFTFTARLNEFVDFAHGRALGPSTTALVTAAEERGIPWFRLNGKSLLQFGHGRYQKRIKATMTSQTPQIAVDLAQDKEATNRLLGDLDLPVPAQRVVGSVKRARRAAEQIGFPVVIKPISANHGRGVSPNVTTPDLVEVAVERAQRYGDDVIVESRVPGLDHRMLVVDGRLIAVAKRVPGHVVGNGAQTIGQLVDELNRDPCRGIGHDKPLTRLELDEQAEELLALNGYTSETVPAVGECVYLRDIGNLSTGGTAVDVTDEVHPDNREMAMRAIRAIGLDVGGVDFITTDISKSYRTHGGAICEVNAGPGFRMHLAPREGQPRDVAGPVIDMLFPPGMPRTIPIAAVTGTNGKTTTARMLDHILKQDYAVGLATTDGVCIKGKLVVEGDMTGPTAARMILMDPDVDAAVLETARGGLLRSGLAYNSCNVAACLNVAGDHLGLGGIDTIEQLADLKRILIEVADDMAVLNADDPWCLKMADYSHARKLCYVTQNFDHPLVQAHIRAGGTAVVLEEDAAGETITLFDQDDRIPIMATHEIPATLAGRARHNVQNAMFAVAMAHGLSIDAEKIRRALSTFDASFSLNPGRMNVYEGHPFTVILDYAHNPHAVSNICDLVDRMPTEGRRIAVLTAPGDRRDVDIKQVAKVAASHFDHFICHRDFDARGRGHLEVPKMLEQSLLEAGVDAKRIQVLPFEDQATTAALCMAEPGDLILILGENIAQTWQMILDFESAHAAWDSSGSELPPVVSLPQTRVFNLEEYDGMELIRDERGVRLARQCED